MLILIAIIAAITIAGITLAILNKPQKKADPIRLAAIAMQKAEDLWDTQPGRAMALQETADKLLELAKEEKNK